MSAPDRAPEIPPFFLLRKGRLHMLQLAPALGEVRCNGFDDRLFEHLVFIDLMIHVGAERDRHRGEQLFISGRIRRPLVAKTGAQRAWRVKVLRDRQSPQS